MLYSSYVYQKNTAATYITILLLALSVTITNSSTGILIAIMFAGGVLFEIIVQRKLIEKIFSGRNLFLLVSGLFLFVVFFSTNQSMAVNITSWLGKDITYNGRTTLWASALSRIGTHPLIGTGPSLVLDVGWGVTMTHAHDLYLNVATKYGIPAVVFLIACIIRAFRYSRGASGKLAYYSLALYLVGSIVEVYSTNTFFLLCVTLALWGTGNTVIGKRLKITFSRE